MSQSFWIRQISYKIKPILQPIVKQFLNIYFLTTIRFFARFPRFVYTMYRQHFFTNERIRRQLFALNPAIPE